MGRLLPIIGVVLLLLVVPLAMCVGLGDDDDDGRARPRSLPPPVDAPPAEVLPAETEEPIAEEEEPEPVGIREIGGVVRGLDDEPLEGIEVADETSGRLDVTDAEGRYRLRRVTSAATVIVARAPGYAEQRIDIEQGRPGDDLAADFQLEAGETAGGRVTDPEGRPLRAARVRCADRSDLVTESDDHGRFELPPGAIGCAATAEHDSHGASGQVVLERGPDNVLSLASPSSISGVVVDGGGAPISTFVLSIESFRPAEGSSTRSYRQTFSHPQGRFTISRAAAGTYVLRVEAPRHEAVNSPPLVVEAGKDLTGVRIVLP